MAVLGTLCALALVVVLWPSERTAHIDEIVCADGGTAYHVSVDDSGAAWGAQFGIVTELPEQIRGASSVEGELRDGVFYGPHGLVVRDLTQAGIQCSLSG